jgi:NADPH oxidase
VGDWTRALATRLASSSPLPKILLDGPFGGSCEKAYKFKHAVLIGLGIGVTPFASILKDVLYHQSHPSKRGVTASSQCLEKVSFVWVCREKTAFEWFQALLDDIERKDQRGFIQIYTFLTMPCSLNDIQNIVVNCDQIQCPITRLKSKTWYGRPHWDTLLTRISQSYTNTKYGIFFCGPESGANQVKQACSQLNRRKSITGNSFSFHKEEF